MSLLNKTTIIIFSVFFLFVCHLWFEAYGIVGLGVQQNNFTWMFVGIVIGLGCFAIFRQKKITIPEFWWKGGIAILVVLLPLAASSKEYFSQGYLLPLGLIFIWLFVLSVIQFEVFRNNPEYLALLILASITIQVFWGFLETFHGVMFNITHGKVLMDPAAVGVFNQKNTFGSFLATGLALSLFIFARCNYGNNRLQKASYYLHLIFVLLASFTVVFSNSRAAYIGSILGVLFVFPYAFQANKGKALPWLVMGCAGLLIALIVLSFTGRVEKELAQGGARVGFYISSFYAILDAPFFGHGLGSFQQVFLEKFAELYSSGSLPKGSSHGNLAHPHNELLLWGVEGGFTAIVGLIGLAAILLRSLWSKSTKFFAVIGILLPIIAHSMVEMPFYQSSLHLIVLSLLYILGFYLLSNKKNKVLAIKGGGLLPIIGGSIGGISLILFSLNIASLNKLHRFIKDDNRRIGEIQDVYLHLGWDDTYFHMYYGSLSQLGIKNNKPELSKSYIEWAERAIDITPKTDYYIALIYAYENSGELEKAFRTVAKLDHYYPTDNDIQMWIDNFYKHMEEKGHKKDDYIE